MQPRGANLDVRVALPNPLRYLRAAMFRSTVGPQFARATSIAVAFLTLAVLGGCSSTEVLESPRTAVVSGAAEAKEPELVWTTRSSDRTFDYLGTVRTRAWTYDGALERLVDGARQLKADAVVDIHFERVGFFTTMEAFAVKYR